MPAQEPTLRVIISDDKASAQLVIPAGCDPALVTEPMLLGLIRGEDVEVTDFTNQAIKSFLAESYHPELDACLVIARLQPPVHGTDGSIQWFVDEKKTQADNATKDHANATDKAVSFYDRCAFVMVQAGDIVGKIHPPVIGQDGRDVTGETIPARSGKEASLKFDNTLVKHADGSLVSQQDGVLYRETGTAQVRKCITIRDYVDFSTGNIDFDGDVTIGKGVRDCFIVKATGSVEVRGLIEAATIITGKDLHALGGFAGRESGTAIIAGSLFGKYLDNVQGHVKQDLCIDREVINCDLLIDGDVRSPRGSIIGGTISPTGEIEIGTLGSPAGTITELVIGSVPALEPFASKLAEIVQTLADDKDKLTDEQDTINKLSTKGRMSATDKERQAAIMSELSTVTASLDKAQRTFDNLNNEINKRRRVHVSVMQMVNPNTTLILDGSRYKIYDDQKGPIRFYMQGKVFMSRQGDATPRPVVQIADVSPVKPDKPARHAA